MKILEKGFLLRKALNPKAEMPFLEHLEELRWRVLWSLLAVVVGSVAGLAMVYYWDVLALLIRPGEELFGDQWRLIYLAPTDAFFIFLKVSLTIGVVLASPIVIYQLWSFLSPALEKHEKRAIVPALYMGLVLFAAGVAMAYFIALPISLRFLVGFLTEFMEASWTATGYMGFVVKLLLAFGVVFELPVVVLILSALGLVTPTFLKRKRRHAIVIITILASLLSPGDVVMVTILMMVPLILLYEISILISAVMWRRRESHRASIEASSPPGGAVAERDSRAPGAGPASPGDPGERRTDETVSASPYTHGDPAVRVSAEGTPSAPKEGKPSGTEASKRDPQGLPGDSPLTEVPRQQRGQPPAQGGLTEGEEDG